MKTFLQFIFALIALLAGAFLMTDQIPDAVLVFASAISASLAAWTLRQYERTYNPLTRVSPWRLRLVDARREPPAPPLRLAA